MASAAAVGLYTWQIEPHWVQVVRRPMALPGLPLPWLAVLLTLVVLAGTPFTAAQGALPQLHAATEPGVDPKKTRH